jgi:uncharacterized protein (TIGR03435 family)
MRTVLFAASLALAITAAAPRAQAPTVFEAASIKPNTSGGAGAGFQIFPGGQFRATNATVRQLVQAAYDFTFERFQVVGGPSWIDVDRFDVQATPSAAATPDRIATAQEIAVRIQRLLADRFHLVSRRETREMPRFELVVARPGLLKPNAGTCAPRGPAPKDAGDARPYCGLSFPPDTGDVQHMVAVGVTIATLARRLQGSVEAIVVDQTGLTGAYDFSLDYLRARNLGGQQDANASASSGVSIFTAVQEQLGLRLESSRGPVEMLVIEEVEKPTAD